MRRLWENIFSFKLWIGFPFMVGIFEKAKVKKGIDLNIKLTRIQWYEDILKIESLLEESCAALQSPLLSRTLGLELGHSHHFRTLLCPRSALLRSPDFPAPTSSEGSLCHLGVRREGGGS